MQVTKSEAFVPSLRGILVNPFYIARRGLYRELKDLLPRFRGRVLDLGCGTKPYRHLAVNCDDYVGLEVDTEEARRRAGADVYYDGKEFPFPDHSFDSILCSQVLEHVFQPADFLTEVRRVLRPGGLVLLTVPFVWDEHEQPVDYARYSSFGLASLMRGAGFEVIEQRKTWPNSAVLFQLTAAWLYKLSRPLPRPVRGVWQLVLLAPITLLGLVCSRILPDNRDLFLDNILLARKPSGRA